MLPNLFQNETTDYHRRRPSRACNLPNTEVQCFYIFGESITIIDSGVKDSFKLIYDYIEKNNRKIGEIKTLILSHSHPDHIGSAKKIKMDTGCKIIGHLHEKDWIENIDLQYKNRPVPGFYSLVDRAFRTH